MLRYRFTSQSRILKHGYLALTSKSTPNQASNYVQGYSTYSTSYL